MRGRLLEDLAAETADLDPDSDEARLIKVTRRDYDQNCKIPSSLVQELQEGWDALVVLDAVDLGRPPGQVMLILPDVIDVHALSLEERMDLLADMHLATPERVFMLSRALGILPSKLLMVGCQPEDAETPGKEMSAPVTAAVEVAIKEVMRHVDELLAEAAAETPAGETA